MIFPPQIHVNRDARPVCTPVLRNLFHCLGQQPRQDRPTHILAAANWPPTTGHRQLATAPGRSGRSGPPLCGGTPPATPPCSYATLLARPQPVRQRPGGNAAVRAQLQLVCDASENDATLRARLPQFDSRLTTHDSRLTIHDSRFTPATSSAACAAAGMRAPNAAKRLSSVWPRTYRT